MEWRCEFDDGIGDGMVMEFGDGVVMGIGNVDGNGDANGIGDGDHFCYGGKLLLLYICTNSSLVCSL